MKYLIIILIGLGAITARAITPQELERLKANEKELRALNEEDAVDLDKALAEEKAAKDETALVKKTADTLKASESSARTSLVASNRRLDYIEPKYQAAVGLLWKWRLFAIGTWAVLGLAIAAKFYFKFPIP